MPQKLQNQTAVTSLYHRTNIFKDSLITRIKQINQLTQWFLEPGGSVPHSQGFLIIPILSRINPISRIYTYSFKVILLPIIILPSYLRLVLPKGLFSVVLPVKIFESTPTFLHFGYMRYSPIKSSTFQKKI